jgi:hypothetical protein
MPVATYGISLTVGGVAISKTITRSAQHPNPYEVELPVGAAGTLTTRTDADSGVVTATGHGLANADLVCVFWAGGRRYGMAVTDVAGDAVTVDGGEGDDLPVVTTPVVITKQQDINTEIDGEAIQIIGLVAEAVSHNSVAKAHIDMQDGDDATVCALDLHANVPQVYDIAGGAANIFDAAPIRRSMAANGSATEVLILKITSMENVT